MPPAGWRGPVAPRKRAAAEPRPAADALPPAAHAPAAGAPRARRFVATKVEIEGREETRIVELPDRDPAPWQAGAELHVVGQRLPRADALEKVTGAARFTVDLQRPGMLFAAVVRAPVAAGRVTAIDASAALAMPGVRGVLTLDDVRGIRTDAGQLLDDTIRYAGQPLCAGLRRQLHGGAGRRGRRAGVGRPRAARRDRRRGRSPPAPRTCAPRATSRPVRRASRARRRGSRPARRRGHDHARVPHARRRCTRRSSRTRRWPNGRGAG